MYIVFSLTWPASMQIYWNKRARLHKSYRVFSHDVTAAILVSQNNKTATMLVSQTSPVGVEFFSFLVIILTVCQ